MRRELTGRHVLFTFVAAFGVIVSVNLTMAWQAVSTFPGRVVQNSFMTSQTFDEERRAQARLGWTLAARLDGGVLTVAFTDAAGAPADVAEVSGLFGRAATSSHDQTPQFERVGPATFAAPVEAQRGSWMLQLRAVAGDGTPWRSRVSVLVR